MPIKRPKSTATPGNPIDATCDNCGVLVSQGDTEYDAVNNAEKRGAEIARVDGDYVIVCAECLKF